MRAWNIDGASMMTARGQQAGERPVAEYITSTRQSEVELFQWLGVTNQLSPFRDFFNFVAFQAGTGFRFHG
jgi:hypothetical protein